MNSNGGKLMISLIAHLSVCTGRARSGAACARCMLSQSRLASRARSAQSPARSRGVSSVFASGPGDRQRHAAAPTHCHRNIDGEREVSGLFVATSEASAGYIWCPLLCSSFPPLYSRSLCYNIPILASLEADPASTALLLFPTKALAQDQQANLKGMVIAAFGPEMGSIVEVSRGRT